MKAFVPIDFGDILDIVAVVTNLYSSNITDITLVMHGVKDSIDSAKRLQKLLKKYGITTNLHSIKYKSREEMPYNVISAYVDTHDIAAKEATSSEPVLVCAPVHKMDAIDNIIGPLQHAERAIDTTVIHTCPLINANPLDLLITSANKLGLKKNKIDKFVKEVSKYAIA